MLAITTQTGGPELLIIEPNCLEKLHSTACVRVHKSLITHADLEALLPDKETTINSLLNRGTFFTFEDNILSDITAVIVIIKFYHTFNLYVRYSLRLGTLLYR